MTKRTVTVEWEGVLRIQTIEIKNTMVALGPPLMIGVAADAVVTPGGNPIPIELILTPIQAAAILALFQKHQQEGHIPPKPDGPISRHFRH